MTLLALIKFLHLIIAITLFGLCIASCYYMQTARKNPEMALYEYTLKQTLRLDYWIILPLLIITFVFGTGMVHLSNLSLHVAWVRNAYLFLTLNLICWAISTGIRRHNLKQLEKRHFSAGKIHLILQLIVIVIFVLIIHDAVTQSTWFGASL